MWLVSLVFPLPVAEMNLLFPLWVAVVRLVVERPTPLAAAPLAVLPYVRPVLWLTDPVALRVLPVVLPMLPPRLPAAQLAVTRLLP